ncbi:MAG: DNA alkylation repair protein [Bacteroidia bacterium]
MNSKTYVSGINKLFLENSDPERAEGAKAYMRNLFDFYGLSSPIRKSLAAGYIKENGVPDISELENIIELCWKNPNREMQYFGMDLAVKLRKKLRKEDIALIEYMITEKSWWDTVDMVAARCAGEYFRKFPEEIEKKTEEWIRSGNMWLMRSALLLQLHYKKETDTELLEQLILKCRTHKDFFIRKAIGWSLRQYAKSNPTWVKKFAKEHELSPLSIKEALKNIG